MIHEGEDMRLRLAQFHTGDLVRILPHHWLINAGADSGTIVKVGRSKIHVRALVNGVTYAISPFGAERV